MQQLELGATFFGGETACVFGWRVSVSSVVELRNPACEVQAGEWVVISSEALIVLWTECA